MSKTLELTDDQYETFSQAAAARGVSPAELLATWIEELREVNREPQHYETADWFRHLGATEEQIAEAKRIAGERSRARNRERGDANT
ncbi:MAG TPA: hypothetical protein VF120_02105 [Ktedonobacterales bacterium]